MEVARPWLQPGLPIPPGATGETSFHHAPMSAAVPLAHPDPSYVV